MLMTVAQYAESRDISVATVKNHIKRLNLDLPENPNDRRQRMLSIDHQIALDVSTRRSAPSALEVEAQEPIQYQRSEAVAMTLAEHSLLNAQIAPLRTADQNPLYQALAQQVQVMQAQNALQIHQIYQQGEAQRDCDASIEAMDQMAIVQRAIQRAATHHHLEQQVYTQHRTDLNLASRGIQPNSPTAQTTVPQSQPSASSSPDWL